MKSGNLKFLEPSGPLQACNGTDLPPVSECFNYPTRAQHCSVGHCISQFTHDGHTRGEKISVAKYTLLIKLLPWSQIMKLNSHEVEYNESKTTINYFIVTYKTGMPKLKINSHYRLAPRILKWFLYFWKIHVPRMAVTCGYGEELSGSINAGNFLTSCKV